MASSASSSGQGDMSCAPIVKAHTEECLREMKNMSPKELAKVFILIGRTGVGKSALLEYLTNSNGHSKDSPNPVTLDFQLEPVDLGKRYYIMDTPGFDTDSEQDVFRKIIAGINAVRPYARIIGVLLVTRINDSRAEKVDNKLVAFVNKLCGPAYAGQITAVTNFWNVSESVEKTRFEERLQQCLQRWRVVLGDELKQYQHGRRYNSFGDDTGECLKWHGDRDDIKMYAKAMLDRHYGNTNLTDPVIVQELSNGNPLWKTAAGEFLGIAPPPESSSRASAPPPVQAEATVPPVDTSEPEEIEIPMPSASTHQANSNQPQPPTPTEPSALAKFLAWTVDEVGIPILNHLLNNVTFSVTSGGGTGQSFPSHLDPLSSRDHFVWRGLPADLESRTEWAQRRGITSEPGSQAFGDAVRNAVERERPM